MRCEMPMEEMLPLIENAINMGGMYAMCPKGVSMLPTIKPLEDSVLLTAPDEIRKYDIVLYRRTNGKFVLHRVVCIGHAGYVMCGDNQCAYEHGIKRKQLIAKVAEIHKSDGSIIRLSDKSSIRYARILCIKRAPQRIVKGVKRLIYPLYAAIFKRKRQH